MCNRTKDGDTKTINGIDKCLFPFIKLLNCNNIHTKFCCCGHGSDNPHVMVESVKDLRYLIDFLDKYAEQVITTIEPFGDHCWDIKFNGLICTPPRYPSWVDSKQQLNFVKEMRNKIFQRKE